MNKYSFKQIKTHIRTFPELRLSDIEKEDVKNVSWKQFLEDFFTVHNFNKNTIYSDGSVQTKPGRRRSMTDIYKIVSYYYPTVKLSAIYKEIILLIEKGVCCSAICSNIGQRVYRGKGAYDSIGFFNSEAVDEFGVDFNDFGINKCSVNSPSGWGDDYTKSMLKEVKI